MDPHFVKLETDPLVAKNGEYNGPFLDAAFVNALGEWVARQLT